MEGSGGRAACRLVPHRVVEKGGTAGHRYPSPGLGPSSTSVPGLRKFIAGFVARQTRNWIRKLSFGRLLSFRPPPHLAAAVRAVAIHARGAARTEGAFVAADARLGIK